MLAMNPIVPFVAGYFAGESNLASGGPGRPPSVANATGIANVTVSAKPHAADTVITIEPAVMVLAQPTEIIEIPQSAVDHRDLERALQEIFKDFGATEKEIADLVAERIDQLTAEGIDAEKLQQLIGTAQRWDTLTGLLHGAVQGSLPFVGASLAVDLALGDIFNTEVTSNLFALGASVGVFQGVVDVIAGTALRDLFTDAYYTRPPVAEGVLAQPVSDLLDTRKASMGEQVKSLVPALTGAYSVRNIFRAGTDIALVATVGPAAVPIANLVIDSVGGLAAGAGMQHMLNRGEQQALRMHPAILLSRPDCVELLVGLDKGMSMDTIKNAGAAMAGGAADVLCGIPSGIKGLASGVGLTEIGVLTAGLALVLPAQASAAEALVSHGAVVQETVNRVVNTIGLGVVYASLAASVASVGSMSSD
jgi:hypothetical protein